MSSPGTYGGCSTQVTPCLTLTLTLTSSEAEAAVARAQEEAQTVASLTLLAALLPAAAEVQPLGLG